MLVRHTGDESNFKASLKFLYFLGKYLKFISSYMAENNSQNRSNTKIRIVTKVLTKALKLWLRSQVSAISQLEVEIQASDKQLLSGYIPRVLVFASHAVYQGLHLTQIELAAENIQIDIGSVLKGHPLRLSQVVPVIGELIVEQEALNASLTSDLLSTALNEVLHQLLPEYRPKTKGIIWQEIFIEQRKITLTATQSQNIDPQALEVNLGLDLLSGNKLQISPIKIQESTRVYLESEDGYKLDLGSDVDIQDLTLMPGKLLCNGKININP